MLIKIDDSLIHYLKKHESDLSAVHDEIQALNNLTLAHRDRKHILIGTLNSVEYLKDFSSLDNTAQRIFSHLYNKFSFMGSYEEIFNSKIIVKSREYHFSKEEDQEEKKVSFTIPITYFIDIESISKTTLIGEDTSDCRFYNGLAKKYIIEKYGNSGFSLSFHLANGGGNNTWSTLKYYCEDKRISITVADSDKKYPGSNIGNTLRRIKTEYEKHKDHSVAALVELPVREKENLIPPSLYLYCCNSSDKSKLEKLKLVEETENHHEKLFYLDFKEGLTAKIYKGDVELQNFIEGLLQDFPILATCDFEEIEKVEDSYKIVDGVSSNISDYFSNGFFYDGLDEELEKKLKLKDIPEEVINELKLNIEVKNKMFNHIPIKFKTHIEELCERLVDWGCSNNTFIST